MCAKREIVIVVCKGSLSPLADVVRCQEGKQYVGFTTGQFECKCSDVLLQIHRCEAVSRIQVWSELRNASIYDRGCAVKVHQINLWDGIICHHDWCQYGGPKGQFLCFTMFHDVSPDWGS